MLSLITPVPLITTGNFTIFVNLLFAVNIFVNYVLGNVLIFNRGTTPIKALKEALTILCYARLHPEQIGLQSIINQHISTIGIPPWFLALTHLLPVGSIGIKGIFTISITDTLTQAEVQKLISNLQSNLLNIRTWYLFNGSNPTVVPTILTEASRKTDITVLFCYPEPGQPGFHFFFPSYDGFKTNLSWLFALLFLPNLGVSIKPSSLIISDFTRFANLLFTAKLAPALLNQLQLTILHWYFNGHTVGTNRISSSGIPPRSPQTGQPPAPQSRAGRGRGRGSGSGTTSPGVASAPPSTSPSSVSEEQINASVADISARLQPLIKKIVNMQFGRRLPRLMPTGQPTLMDV